jgi:predicted enzyme related to lactoylglutathione lyase
MNRVIHFEICAKDLNRASEFYKNVFEWDIQDWGGMETYRLVNTGKSEEPGINGGLMMTNVQDFQGTINTISVSDIDKFIEKIEASGGVIVRPKTAIPGVGYQAYCRDTEGNMFGIHKEDPGAYN